MGQLSLHFLDPSAQALVTRMLAVVVDHSDVHMNRFTIRRTKSDEFEYFVGQKRANSPTPFPQYSRLPTNIVPQLMYYRFAEVETAADAPSGWYRFTGEALEWHRQTHTVPAAKKENPVPVKYFHVRVTRNSDSSRTYVRLDLSEEQLEERVLLPYREGRPIVIGGTTIPIGDIKQIRINTTEESAETIRLRVRAQMRESRFISFSTPEDWYVADYGPEATDDFITGPPGTCASAITENSAMVSPRVEDVFVVHGRDSQLRDSVFVFLRAIGLHPLEWSEAVAATNHPTPYIGEVLDQAFAMAQAVIVLLTPDDEARLRPDFLRANDPPYERELTGQARPNVLFEAGMAMGRDATRTVLVELGTLRPFSDIGGRHVVRLDNSTQRRQEFAARLQRAGCPVNLRGTDWHTVGQLTPTRAEGDING